MDKDKLIKTLGVVLAGASAAQGYFELIPLDPLMSSGVGFVLAGAVFFSRLILSKIKK